MAGILGPPSGLPWPLSPSPLSIESSSPASLNIPNHFVPPSSSLATIMSSLQLRVIHPQSSDPSGGIFFPFNPETFPPLLIARSASVFSQLE
ncbi:hypothetical protein Nepgr_017244 [Nepenthes gracilis]|uniref:Uncharacterized protein n=1 Tax=Nepenthes gracilis TaxID=150966 RepID=A0AAD3XSB3_NEPGR|nr:hypothetical protein Nepgr_017244 [Nepenthes gracilis]